MINKLFMCCLTLVVLSTPCPSDERPQIIEPNGLFWIEGTLWGYEKEGLEDVALGFYKGSVYLVSLGVLPITLKAQTSDYYDFFLFSYFTLTVQIYDQQGTVNGILFPILGVGFDYFPDRLEEGTRNMHKIDDRWAP